MNYAVIVAGGQGKRVQSIDVPKQYYEIDGMAIILYSLRKMLNIDMFDKIYIVVNDDYKDHVNKILDECVKDEKREMIKLVSSGKERIDSVHNALEELKKEDIRDDDIVVIHDAARPFVSEEILINNIKEARQHGAVVTAVPATDTMLMVDDDKMIDSIPERKTVYKEQTPTSANLKLLLELEENLTEEDKKHITGTAQIFTFNNCKVKIVEGSDSNFKITNDEDLERARQKIFSK